MLEYSYLFEAFMLICFGCAWPISIYKSYISRTNKGKSIHFLYVIFIGYINGVIFQYITFPNSYDIYLMILNAVMVFIDILLYWRNFYFDRKALK